MSIYKKISIALLMISMIILFVACRNHVKLNNKEEVFFPKGDNGYPQNNIVMINGKQYLLKHIESAMNNSHVIHEIDLELSEETEGMVEVILPQNIPINFWSIGVNEEIDFISYHKIDYPIEDKDIVEGVSATLQKFCFIVPLEKDTSISFKWSNVNEIEKSFNDRDENYLFKIKIFR
ncbi:hypothetical protein HMPREF0389_01342 [Filifactor alocis ATCC 35896]|uniref:Uncharacterized protein n=1 Tax=Filifactor alocis (strain ATCC 35896 / CCUG 47790 / D40 B5) TaxID=546269 RepID=D6GTA4_FILAD|nr:hypothetical protein [Filifactor alocis]EFE27711.1 hypothetical protein HMPREF0389_01342 [Filifactor alocis ATCC 35896]